jgi:hypothetical protein
MSSRQLAYGVPAAVEWIKNDLADFVWKMWNYVYVGNAYYILIIFMRKEGERGRMHAESGCFRIVFKRLLFLSRF